jgi:regulator-associated protein of mTOR
MKTVSVALIYCLNIGTEPPDVLHISPCANLECWINPATEGPPAKALENIGKALQAQYERWQPRARYKQCLDPTLEDVKKLCLNMRRNAKDERVLLHYNGHGVPRPTNNGEIWVFNKSFTQYIPLSIYELQGWMGSPSIYVFDSHNAGLIVHWFTQFAEQREKEHARVRGQLSSSSGALTPISAAQAQAQAQAGVGSLLSECILLAACGKNEMLPSDPSLPGDVFTSCLTTPIRIALRWFISQKRSRVAEFLTPDKADDLPGNLNNRRTPLGELNWIFTSITDTIAWHVLPRDLFQKLFRQDLLVASLFRNFLLAERILRSANCTPISRPALPPTFQHPMWQAWDYVADECLAQLPGLLADPPAEYKFSTFFSEQLTAFEIWLQFGHVAEKRRPPEQLPIVLQVLLSQTHRLRALVLLGRFLDLGPWAVNQALAVGIFPYVLKLLQSQAVELRQILIFIWAKILAFDESCQADLIKESSHIYFLNVLAVPNLPSSQRVLALFILSAIVASNRQGQLLGYKANLLSLCAPEISNRDPMMRRWSALCLAKLWEANDEVKNAAIQLALHEKLCGLLTDPVVEVRAAAVYALGTFLGGPPELEMKKNIDLNLGITLPVVSLDGSTMVRRELVLVLGQLTQCYERDFLSLARERAETLDRLEQAQQAQQLQQQDELKKGQKTPTKVSSKKSKKKASKKEEAETEAANAAKANAARVDVAAQSLSQSQEAQASVYSYVWKILLSLCDDPFPNIAELASAIVHQATFPFRANPSEKAGVRRGSSTLRELLGKQSRKKKTAAAAAAAAAAAPGEAQESDGPSQRSTFYEWSAEWVATPLMVPADDPSAPSEVAKRKRQQQNEVFLSEVSLTWAPARRTGLEDQIAIFDNEMPMATRMAFHPFEGLLFVNTNPDTVSVWLWEEGTKLNSFSACEEGRLTSLHVINETSGNYMLLTGSSNGVVRVWRDSELRSGQRLASSWCALTDLRSHSSSSMSLCWQRHRGQLLAAGDSPVVRVWDVEREFPILDIPTMHEYGITSLASAVDESTVIAGTMDGALKQYDLRAPGRASMVAEYTEHSKWVVDVHVPRSSNKFVSGSVLGDVKFWDTRSTHSMRTMTAFNDNTMTSLAVHPYAPLLACGSQTQKIKVANFDGEELGMIRYHDGFLGQRIGPVSSLTFHPYRVLLAAGATDTIVSLYSGLGTDTPTVPPKK